MSASVAGSMLMRPSATATRCVLDLAATSTMWAWPSASKWVSGLGLVGSFMAGSLRGLYRNLGALAASYEDALFDDSPIPVVPPSLFSPCAAGCSGGGTGVVVKRTNEPSHRRSSRSNCVAGWLAQPG